MPTQRKLEKLMAGAQQLYQEGETMQAAIGGTYEGNFAGNDIVRDCVLVATDARVIFFALRLGGYDHESFPYGRISSIDSGKTLMGHKVTLYASGNTVSIKWVKDPGLPGFLEYVNARLTEGSAARSQPSASEPDVLDQLRKLGELRTAGVITADDFETKKTELLSRI